MGLTRAGSAIAGGALLVAALGSGTAWAWRDRVNLASGAWLAALLFSATLIGTDTAEGLRQTGGFWPLLVVPGAMLAAANGRPLLLLWLFLGGSAAAAVVGIVQVNGWCGVTAITRAEGGIDIFSFAMVTSAGAVCAEYLYSVSERRRAKLAAAALGLLSVMGMLCADSRAPFAVFAAVVLFLLVAKRRWKSLFALAGVAAWVALASPSWTGMGRIRNLGEDMENPRAAFSARLLMWEASQDMFRQSPWVGVGLGDYKPTFNRMAEEGLLELTHPSDLNHRHAHNIFIHTSATQGMVGFSVLLLWLVTLLRRLQRSPDRQRVLFGLAVLGLEVGGGLTDNSIYLTPHLNAFCLLLGVLIAPWPQDRATGG